MKLIHLSNYFNHHVKSMTDALYRLLGDDYAFVETESVPQFRLELGYKELSSPYVIKYNEDTRLQIETMIMDADVVICGEAPVKMVKARYASGKLTFKDDECRYRSMSRFLKWPIYTYYSLFQNKGYLLCASAYGPIDYLLSGMNPKKCYRWGYFTEVKNYGSPEQLMQKKSSNSHIKILWCGRMIPLKHPEALIYVSNKLRNDGYDFEINVIGTGKLENKIKKIVRQKNLDPYINFLGSMKPEKVRSYMEESDIFLFTSDRNEGWGAVLNESMNSGCAVVAGNNIGSVPFLLEDGINGLIYRDLDWDDLYSKVKDLIENPEKRKCMGAKAYRTMIDVWNGENAAQRLVTLCNALLLGNEDPIKTGPCSPAPLLMRKWHGKFKTI